MIKKSNQLSMLTLVVCIAGLSMGNQSCETTTSSARLLKMDVEVGTLNAKVVTLPDGETVDFPYVVNSLFYREVIKNEHFVITNPISTNSAASASATATAVSGTQSLSLSDLNNDQKLLLQYGFLKTDGSHVVSSNSVHTESTVGALQSSSMTATTDPQACLYDLPQATLGGEVDSFAVTGGGGVSVGYSTGGSSNTTTTGLGGTIQYTAASLEMGFRSDDPLSQNTIVVADGVATQSKISASVAFPAGGVPLGLNFFYNTPIADAISSAMDKGIATIVSQYIKMLSTTGNWNDVWESRVVYDPQISDQDTTVAIRGGYRAGVQVGDEFSVTNLHYMWAGATCSSLLKYKIPLTTAPIATIKVIAVGDNVSVAQVTQYSGDTKIESGAQVKISSLYVAPKASPTPTP